MKYILLLALLLAGCSDDKLTSVNSDLQKRFLYKYDIEDEWNVLDTEGIVYGDCEDYALTIMRDLKWEGELLIVEAPGGYHAIYCLDGRCVDNRKTRPFTLKRSGYRLDRVVPMEEIKHKLGVQ